MPSYSRQVAIPGFTAQQLYDKVSADISRVMEKASMGKVDIQSDPQSMKVQVKSSMFSAELLCLDGCLKLDGKISLLAAPFRSKIDEGIDRWLKKTFNL